ncbi:MAG: protein phosphatase 2C domain-containing protein [Niastella sp.]|nr:protein phosphatase 2C domain-containing protein [Niastella sp.]
MKIYSALQIGDYHTNHCEDYLFIDSLGKNKYVAAVMDGCTMGTDSYLASTLTGKLLRKIVKSRNYKDLYTVTPVADTPEVIVKSVLAELFRELAAVKNQLLLDQDELLTTLMLLLADKEKNEGFVLVIGDGLVCINGQVRVFDHDNKPDYIGFHLGKDFEEWYAGHFQKLHFHNIADISIATDGIELFTRVTEQQLDVVDPVDFLVRDTEDVAKDDMLELKLKKLDHQFGMRPGDDLAIIRIINNIP